MRCVLLLALVFFSMTSCGKHRTPPPPSPSGVQVRKDISVIYHQVRYRGETLAGIAKWYTGDAKNWKKLAHVNPDVNPDRMYSDLVIRIPRDLCRQTVPYDLVQLRRMQRGMLGLPDVAPLLDEKEDPAGDAGGTEPVDMDAAAALKEQEPAKEEAPRKAEAKDESPKKMVQPVALTADDEAAKRRRELQEKTREEILREMLSEDSLQY